MWSCEPTSLARGRSTRRARLLLSIIEPARIWALTYLQKRTQLPEIPSAFRPVMLRKFVQPRFRQCLQIPCATAPVGTRNRRPAFSNFFLLVSQTAPTRAASSIRQPERFPWPLPRLRSQMASQILSLLQSLGADKRHVLASAGSDTRLQIEFDRGAVALTGFPAASTSASALTGV